MKEVKISAEEYARLLKSEDELNCLECNGVDNWVGYGMREDWEDLNVDKLVQEKLIKDDNPKFDKAKESTYENDYRIENDVDAEKMVKLIADLKSDKERLIAVCEESIKEYQMKIQGYEEEISNMVTPIESALFHWMQNQEVKETKTQFSYKLPSATLKYTKAKTDYAKDDSKLLEWVKDNKAELVKVKESVDWATLKKELKIVENKAITKDGEIVEGVEIVEKSGKFEIK